MTNSLFPTLWFKQLWIEGDFVVNCLIINDKDGILVNSYIITKAIDQLIISW